MVPQWPMAPMVMVFVSVSVDSLLISYGHVSRSSN